MPRRTPVRDILKEEVVSSPVRRSSRLSTSSPVPTRVVTRRNSSSEETSQTAKPTRTRRLSLSQETETNPELEKKKPTSTIRTRRSSLTQSQDEDVIELVRVTRSRASSIPKEETPVKRTTRRRGSTTEEPETSEETAKKTTRSKTFLSEKSNEGDNAKDAKKKSSTGENAASSTPVKKSGSISEPLEPIKEASKEVDSPVEVRTVKSKRKTMEASKIDFDLSVINETSIIEESEEGSPKKTKEHSEAESEIKTKPQDDSIGTKEDLIESVPESDPMKPKAPEIEQKLETSFVKNINTNVEAADSTSDVSFHLQLSSSMLENSPDSSNKENVCPAQDSEVEPMDVDDSTYNLFLPTPNKSPKVSIGLKTSEVEEKLQHTEKINDDMAEFLIQQIQINSQEKTEAVNNQEKILDEDVAVQKDSSNALEIPQNSAKEKEVSTPNENSDIAEDMTEVKESTVERKERVESDDVEERSAEPLYASTVEGNGNSSFSADEDSLREHTETGTNEEVSTEIPVEKEEKTNKDLTCNTEQTVAEASEAFTMNEDSTKSKSASNKDGVADSELENALNNTSERVVVENVNILEEDLRLSSAETETISSRACSEAEQNGQSSVNEPDQFREVILNVDENSYDDINKASDGGQDETGAMPIVTVEETSRVGDDDDDLKSKLESFVNAVIGEDDPDLEPETVAKNTGEDATLRLEETINLCDSDDANYASPVKKSKQYLNVSDIIENRSPKRKSDIFERSIDSSYSTPLQQKRSKEKGVNVEDVVELSDQQDENVEDIANDAVNSTLQNSNSVIHDVSEKDRSITTEILEQEIIRKDDDEAEKDVATEAAIFEKASKRHSKDKTTITMQDTLKAGDDNAEKRLPDRIRQVVDLFCQGLNNKSDVSVNVSLEYTGPPSDNEDENDQLNFSLSVSEIKVQEASHQKGSKRRKICNESNSSVSLEALMASDTTESPAQIQTSPKTPVPVINEEKPSSAKKRKRKSTFSEEFTATPDFKNATVVKSSPKVSFVENDNSAKKKKNRKSLETSIENLRKTSPKKPVPLTPYRLPQSDKSTEHDTTAESTDYEGNDSTVSSSKDYHDLLARSFQEDDHDQTWTPEEDGSSDAHATYGSDVPDDLDEEEDDEGPLTDEKAASEPENYSDDVFIPNEEQQKYPKTRRMFRLSKYNVSNLFESSDSEKVASEEEKVKTESRKEPTDTAVRVVEKKGRRKKKAKHEFDVANVSSIAPETSEVKVIKNTKNQNRKRKYQNSTSLDEAEECQMWGMKNPSSKNKIQKPSQPEKKPKKEILLPIKPSTKKSRKDQIYYMRPSSKTCSGWDVTTL